MRDDFHSVFTDGSGKRYPYARIVADVIRDDDDLPVPRGRRIRRLDRSWREDWCRRYALVDRFLRSRLGHPWPEVLAEVAHAVAGTPSGHAVLDQAQRLVCSGGLVDGRLVSARGYRLHGFYVDAEGRLAELPTLGYRDWNVRQAHPHLVDPASMRLGHGHAFSRIDGVWYELRWTDDVAGARDARSGFAVRRYTLKRQLGRREIDRAGLRIWPDLVAEFRASIRNRRYDRTLKRRMESMARKAADALAA
jgi:hypothetical protein